MPQSLLFDEAFLRKLEQLSLVIRRVRAGHFKGDRRSTRRGQSIEFADYRNYMPGDDLRALDWNIYARLNRPFIKLFEEEVDQTVYIVLDASASMDWPQSQAQDDVSEHHKWTYSLRLAAALGYIALVNNDRLIVTCLCDKHVDTWGPVRQQGQIHRLLDFLSGQVSSDSLDFVKTLTDYTQQTKRAGLLFLLSDFLSVDDLRPGLNALQSQGHEVTLLHILSPDEISPTLWGDLRLQDIETGQTQDLTINVTLKKLYQQKFEVWQGELNQRCQQQGLNYALLNTAQPFEQVMLQYLRQRGFVR